jgi:hypothetical protein
MLAEAAELAGKPGSEAEEGWAILHRGLIDAFSGDVGQAAKVLPDALHKLRRAHDANGELYALFLLGLVLGLAGDRDRGMELSPAMTGRPGPTRPIGDRARAAGPDRTGRTRGAGVGREPLQ